MPEYSGIAGVVPRAQPQQDPSGGLSGMMERLLNVKSAMKDQAQKQVMGMIEMAKSGFPVDPKAFTKLVKKSGLPLATKDEDIAASLTADHQAKQGEGGAPGKNPIEAVSKQVSQDQASKTQANAMSPEQKTSFWVNSMASRARQLMNTQATTEQKKAENSATIEDLKGKVLAGGPGADEAAGKLIGFNEFHFDQSYNMWKTLNPEQQGRAIRIQYGMEETTGAVNERATRIGESLLSSGKFANPGDAYAAGAQLAKAGGSISPDLQAKMKPYTFKELSQEAELQTQLVALGVPPDMLRSVSKAAMAGGLENALPKGMKPIVIKQLELQQQQVGLEGKRLDKEIQAATAAEKRAEAGLLSEQHKAALDDFKSLVEIKKSGGKISDDLMKGAMIRAGEAFNMDVTETQSLFEHLTGGSHIEMKPRLTPQGASVVDQFSKGKPKQKPGIIENVNKAIKNLSSEPI